MRPHIANVFRRVSGMPSSIIAWLYGASVPCSGDLLVALQALWKRDPSAQNNVIAEGSFSGMVGLPVVVQNSGNGVLIQNATIINLQVK
jgi:hypothetical protein